MTMDYKEIFESVFEKATDDEIGCFLRNEDVPFEYCERALKERRLNWQQRLIVALRSDCPEDVLVKLCKRAGERFATSILFTDTETGRNRLEKEVPVKVLETLFRNERTFAVTLSYCLLTDDMKRRATDKLLETHSDGSFVRQAYEQRMFLLNQCSLPEDCLDRFDEALSRAEEDASSYIKETYDLMRSDMRWMSVPLDEQKALDVINGKLPWGANPVLLKIAANRSISEYVEMMLRVKCGGAIAPLVNKVLDMHRKEREEWRMTH